MSCLIAITVFAIMLTFVSGHSSSLSHLHFDEDGVPSKLYPMWVNRLKDLQLKAIKATSIDTNTKQLHSNNHNNEVSEFRQLFEEFVSLFERSYYGDEVEYETRFQVFMVNIFINFLKFIIPYVQRRLITSLNDLS